MPHFGEVEALMASAAAPPVQTAVVANGGSVSYPFSKRNGSTLLNPVAAIAGCTYNLPSPPGDGQIITIKASQNIGVLTLNPLVPSFPSGLAKDDQYQIKWYDADGYWSILL